jgi:hypothetical protein
VIAAYLINSVTLNQFVGKDKYQKPLTRLAETLKARVDFKERRMYGLDGVLIVSSAKLLIKNRAIIVSGFETRGANTISYKDTLTIDGVEHVIAVIAREQDFRARFLSVYVI